MPSAVLAIALTGDACFLSATLAPIDPEGPSR
jgi:hypothetical protein